MIQSTISVKILKNLKNVKMQFPIPAHPFIHVRVKQNLECFLYYPFAFTVLLPSDWFIKTMTHKRTLVALPSLNVITGITALTKNYYTLTQMRGSERSWCWGGRTSTYAVYKKNYGNLFFLNENSKWGGSNISIVFWFKLTPGYRLKIKLFKHDETLVINEAVVERYGQVLFSI